MENPETLTPFQYTRHNTES